VGSVVDRVKALIAGAGSGAGAKAQAVPKAG
jgi:hypothetical protein